MLRRLAVVLLSVSAFTQVKHVTVQTLRQYLWLLDRMEQRAVAVAPVPAPDQQGQDRPVRLLRAAATRPSSLM
jgi:hypothetical protein